MNFSILFVIVENILDDIIFLFILFGDDNFLRFEFDIQTLLLLF